ncbi:outer membrane beta-barrel protein [Segatella copri]|uniref:Outer membrane beta-barrel protein n=1 Tax=Segatella copri TaxID=165179 RepID=A0AAW4N4T4_9BACT|nr:outer membrane beta-barrel protein [Segatella copri]MBV3387250.1 outer membrane beta-barrel protein [Segatella copri]MBV3395091.1 outer membrane beta-barrel protein [Segatella copri]MBV3404722.1 outer membrane beta-barrel protein [Segatella copri]
MRIGSKLVLILFLFPFTCLAQVKGKVVSVSDSTSTPSANFSLEKELKDVVVVADMVSRNASKETIFITDSLRKGTVSAIQLLAKLPGITTDWGTDEVNVGKDKNVPIVINGKEVKREYAISLNPKRIKKVEIMRYPAGKYSDYPVVLNIELADDYKGWDVSTFTRNLYSFRNKHSNREAIGTSFTYTLPKVNLYGSLSFNHRQNYDVSGYEYSSMSDLMIKSEAADYKKPNISTRNNMGSFSLGADYRLSNNQILSAQAWIERKGTKQNDSFSVFNNDKFYELNSLDDFKTDDYTIGLFYKGKFANHLNLSSELIYNRYDIHEDRIYSEKDNIVLSPYKGNKNYWRYYLSANYYLGNKVSLWADYTQIWKDYSNSDRNENIVLYNSKETRSKLMGAISYQPFRNFNALLGSHLLTVKDENQQTAVSEKHTSWMPLFKGYWKPVKWMYLQYNYFCDVEYPNLDQLSTVRWQVNDVLWHRGNSELKPRIMHYSEITVNFVNIVKIDYMYKQSKDEIIDYYQQEEDKTYQTQANCNYRHNYLGMEGDYNLGNGVELSFVANYQWYHRYMKDDTKHFGRTWYLDTQLLWNVPNTKLSFMASYFLRHDKLPLLQGKQYDEEEKLFVGTSYSLLKGKLPISLEVSIPTSMISKKTYTKVSLLNFAYQIYGDNRVNAFVALISVKYSLGKGKTTKLNNSKNLDMEK